MRITISLSQCWEYIKYTTVFMSHKFIKHSQYQNIQVLKKISELDFTISYTKQRYAPL